MIKLKDLLNEGPQKVGNVNAFGASKVLGKGKKVLGFVPDTPNAVATLIQDFPNAMEIEFKQGFVYKGENHKSIKKGSKVWKELEKRYLDKQTKDAMKAGFNINEAKVKVLTEAKDLKKYPLDVQKEYNKLLNAFGQAFADRYLERYDEDNEPSEPGLKQQIYDKLKLAKQNTAKEIKQKKFGSDKYPTVLLKHFGIELRKLGKITDAQLNQLINKEGIKTIWQETDFVFKIFNKQKK